LGFGLRFYIVLKLDKARCSAAHRDGSRPAVLEQELVVLEQEIGRRMLISHVSQCAALTDSLKVLCVRERERERARARMKDRQTDRQTERQRGLDTKKVERKTPKGC
jgi:hypothetical protein